MDVTREELMHEPQVSGLGDVKVELRLDSSLAPSVLRSFAGKIPLDAEVDALDVPTFPRWLNSCVRLIRLYRRFRRASVGQQCVYDPSCSRYAELALRKHGLAKGLAATAARLCRCRPGRGGVDLP